MTVLLPLYLQFGKYKPDWGDVPTWTAAVLALVAGFIAYRAYVVSKRAYGVAHQIYRVESERDQQAAEERRAREAVERQAQASKVAAWFDDNPKQDALAGPNRFVPGAFVRNASDLPAYNASLIFGWRASLPDEPAREVASNSPGGPLSVIPPGETLFVRIPSEAETRLGDIKPRGWHLVSMEFSDANGVRWERDPYGTLNEL